MLVVDVVGIVVVVDEDYDDDDIWELNPLWPHPEYIKILF